MTTQIGQTIKKLRKSRSLTQRQLGDAIGVTFQQVQKYENGKNHPSIERIRDIAKVLNVGIYDIIENITPEDQATRVGIYFNIIKDQKVRDAMEYVIASVSGKF
jgi:transcriptional regulator with XRE-family HTH domain